MSTVIIQQCRSSFRSPLIVIRRRYILHWNPRSFSTSRQYASLTSTRKTTIDLPASSNACNVVSFISTHMGLPAGRMTSSPSPSTSSPFAKRWHSNESNKNVLSKLDKHIIREELLQAWMIAEAHSPTHNSTNKLSSSASPATRRRARYCCYTYDDAKRDYESRESTWHWLDREMSSNLAGETGAVSIYNGALSALSIRRIVKRIGSTAHISTTKTDSDTGAVEFCKEHYETEESHRQFFHDVLPPDGKRTRLLPLWRLAGYTLGFVPTLFGGPIALYVTVEAVETFVEEHFQDQIIPLKNALAHESDSHPFTSDSKSTITSSSTPMVTPLPSCPELIKLLEACCEDEVHHKEDAAMKLLGRFSESATTSQPHASTSMDSTVVGLEALPSRHLWWARPWSSIVRFGSAVAAEISRRV